MPALSVLLPVRNAGPWLDASLRSLARQTFRDFEIVAVDDGSADDSLERLTAFAARDPRLRVIAGPARGLPAALALAHHHARAPLLARQDADDVSHRERFARQLDELRARPDADVVGTRLRLFPAAAVGAGMRRWAAWHNRLLTHADMAREALIDSPLAHGTALLRREAVERAGGWVERGVPEDVDLWLRMLRSGARFTKLPEVLYGWRQHPGSATRRDPRYGPGPSAALRCEHLRGTLLRDARRATLIGVGASLAGWARRLEAAGVAAETVERARPVPGAAVPAPPVVLVFGAAPARRRWREHLERLGMQESAEFMFVA